jgi:hypothetical protein
MPTVENPIKIMRRKVREKKTCFNSLIHNILQGVLDAEIQFNSRHPSALCATDIKAESTLGSENVSSQSDAHHSKIIYWKRSDD